MAGAFGGLPVGNVGAMSGVDVTPFLQMQRMLDQRTEFERQMQEAMAQRQQQEQMALGTMEFNRQSAAQRMEQDRLDRQQRDRQFGAEQQRLSRGQDQDAELRRASLGMQQEAQRTEMAQTERAFGLKTKEAEDRKAEEAAKQKRTEGMMATGTRASALIAQGLPALRQQLMQTLGREPYPEELRNAMMEQTAALPPDDRVAAQSAVQDWFQSELAGQRARPNEPRPQQTKGLSPATKLAHFRVQTRDLQDKIDDLVAERNIVRNDPAYARMTGKKPEEYDAEIKALRAELEQAQQQINQLLTGEEPTTAAPTESLDDALAKLETMSRPPATLTSE